MAVMRSQSIGGATLARQTGISERLIRQYRSGRVVPRDYFDRPTGNAHKIADALDVDVEDLFPARAAEAAA